MNVEIKPVPGFESATGTRVAQMTAQYFPESQFDSSETACKLPLFSSFSYESLLAAQASSPYIPRGYLISDVALVPDWLTRLRTLNAVSLHTNWKNLTPDIVNAAKEAGFKVFCYTVNSEEDARRLMAMGVDAFCTDKLDMFQHFEC